MKGVHLSALYVGYTYLCTTVQCSLHVKVPCIIHCICIAMHCNALHCRGSFLINSTCTKLFLLILVLLVMIHNL